MMRMMLARRSLTATPIGRMRRVGARHAMHTLSLVTADSADDHRRSFQALAETFMAVEQAKGSRQASVTLLAQRLRVLLPSTPSGSAQELSAALFLTASQLAPPHEGVELRFGAKTFAPVLQRLLVDGATVSWETLLPSLPDYSAAVPLLVNQGAIRVTGGDAQPLTVAEVHQALVAIAREEGTGSQLRKQDRAVTLLQRCQSVDELVVLVRLLAHQKLRIAMGEKSILTALSCACLPAERQDDSTVIKGWTNAVVRAYSHLPDYGALATILCDLCTREPDNLAARTEKLLEAAAPRVGIPVLTMAAYPIGSVRESVTRLRKSGVKRATCEYKYDGARVQLHLKLDDNGVRTAGRVFSRNMEDQTDKYGSLLDVVQAQLRATETRELVMEGEVVAIDPETRALLPFQVLQTKTTTDFCLFAFDLLSVNGDNLMRHDLLERRCLLRSLLSPREGLLQFVERLDVDVPEQDDEQAQRDVESLVRRLLESSVTAGCEGLMLKTLTDGAEYRAGVRSFTWMKLKHDYITDENETEGNPKPKTSGSNGVFLPDTLDLVPIAAFYGKGRRAGVFGSFLLACFDSSSGNFETIGKVGSGFSDTQLEDLSSKLREEASIIEAGADVPEGYVAVMTPSQRPDVWFTPTQVWEIKATQLTLSPSYMAGHVYVPFPPGVGGPRQKSKGLALRFPRFLRTRPEKSPTQATDSSEVAMLFQQQAAELCGPTSGEGEEDE